ncbi:DUF1835 domain-containing protein [Algoriphagus sp. CAU 1675]|uniref:DUF1835 domain-containing protein n=1 Tax=Algoriphagus sp. CAU 1675 TaxID=3032597 RepID=UPI0023DC6B5B|nr:DUF1835 domain-containing protein [Algoriphagus sp. CAU 1675]MDF2158568.1 DUF1835 domain-containing protein [Algoriphagus sp. CAU 1675]
MKHSVHILNGDSLASLLPDQIQGERIVFRECLIDGPVDAESEEKFWETRKKFIQSNFGPSPDYESYSKNEILKIKNISVDSEVYLWFEEDLFCLVNFWKAVDMLSSRVYEAYLVTPGTENPYSFAELDSQKLIERFHSAQHLQKEDLILFSTMWSYFQKEEVFEALHLAEKFSDRFPFLLRAIEAWREMIPLGEFPGKPIETLREIVNELKTEDFEVIFPEFQKRLPIYGLGDLHVKRLLEQIPKERQ